MTEENNSTDIGTNSGENTEINTDTTPDAETNTDTGTNSGTESGTGSDTGSDSDSGADSTTDSGENSGSDSDIELEELYPWIDDVTKEGADYEPNDLNNNLMHLKYVHKPKNLSGRNVGDIFWTMRVDESINGAYPCDGGEFSESDFSGENNPYNLLVLGRIPSVTYEEYAQQMTDNNGNCGFFALDTVNHKFKVPTLHKISIEATKIAGNIGDYIQDQIVNITGKFGADDRMTGVAEGAFSSLGGGYNTGSSGSEAGCAFQFDASAVVNTGDRVKPRTISLRAMVQLANESNDAVSIEDYTNRLEEKTQQGLASLSSAANCLTQTQATNCVLESPQNIKLEINEDGELVLKSGSVLIYPDSVTKTFKEYTTTKDYTSENFLNRQDLPMLYMTGEETGWHLTSCAAGELYCSETAPSASGWWFNPSTFEVKYSDDSGASWDDYTLSMPIAIVTSSAAAFTSIDSVLQNFTFWGTYLMVRSGVKVLASAGRNQNGTLNNENLTSVLGGLNYSFSGSAQAYFGYGKEAGSSNLSVFCADVKDYHYNAEKNTIKLTNDEWVAAVCGSGQITNGKITYLEEKETLRVGDSGPVVTETYRKGTSWYRVWSNGLVEQGGMYTYPDTYFLKKYTGLPNVLVTGYWDSGNYVTGVRVRDTEKFTLYTSYTSTSGAWYASGF